MSAGKLITVTITAAENGRGFHVRYQDPAGPIESLHPLRLFEVTFGDLDHVVIAALNPDDPPQRGWVGV